MAKKYINAFQLADKVGRRSKAYGLNRDTAVKASEDMLTGMDKAARPSFDTVTREQTTPGGRPAATTVIRKGSQLGDKYAKMSNAIDADINRKASARVGERLSSTPKTKAASNEIAADVVVDDVKKQARDKYAK